MSVSSDSKLQISKRSIKQRYAHSGADGEPLAQVCPPAPISQHIHNARQSWGDRTGLALSCFISNGGLPGDSTCQPPEPPVLLTSAIWAAQPHSISGAWAEARASADPSPTAPPLALPQGMSCPLPAAHTWSKDTNSSASIPDSDSSLLQSSTTHRSGRKRLKHLLAPEGPKRGHVLFFFAEPQHSTITTAPRLALTCKLPTKWNPPILRSMSDLAELPPLLLLICAKQCMQSGIKNKLRDHNQSKSLMLVFLLVSKFCSWKMKKWRSFGTKLCY